MTASTQFTIRHSAQQLIASEMTAGTTSAITFRLRLGGNAAGTTTVNGATGARLYGGVGLLRITVDEYLP